jgi:hypothetical protein
VFKVVLPIHRSRYQGWVALIPRVSTCPSQASRVEVESGGPGLAHTSSDVTRSTYPPSPPVTVRVSSPASVGIRSAYSNSRTTYIDRPAM